jgi:hypothetical protein
LDEVAAKTSSTIAFDATESDTSYDSSLFDQTSNAYQRIRNTCEEEMKRHFVVNIHSALKGYPRQALWSSITDTPTIEPSAALDSLLQTINVLLGFLGRVLSPASLRKLTKHFCVAVQNEIYNNVLLATTFSSSGAAQLKRDFVAIQKAVESATKVDGVVGNSMKLLEESVALLSLPVVAEEGGEGMAKWSLWDAERELFTSNEAARAALAAMELEYVGENEARAVLKRRAELSA